MAAIRTWLVGSPRLLDSFSWKGFIAFLGCAVALSAWTWSGVLLTGKALTFNEQAEYFLSLLQRSLLTYSPVYVLVAFTDQFPLQGMQRRLAMIAALILAVLLSVQLRCAAMPNQLYYVYGSTLVPYCTTFPTWRTYLDFPGSVITPFATAGMVMVFLFGRRRDEELARALHNARAAQLMSHRQRLESDLEAMQSRVDPDVLFKTLADIRARYETSAAEGEAMLDALIQRLRAAARSPAPEATAT